MGFKCGIVGLPNVGKSTLFNALTKTAAAQAANYPFCTIEPNTGEVAVPDPRMQKLASIAGSKEIIPTRISFVDIAGLVRGASKGEGLGNQFLANIRETDAIVHVVRAQAQQEEARRAVVAVIREVLAAHGRLLHLDHPALAHHGRRRPGLSHRGGGARRRLRHG